jgi:hypothetical protein
MFLFCFCYYCVFQEICLLFKFGGAFVYVTPDLHGPSSIVSRHIGDKTLLSFALLKKKKNKIAMLLIGHD